MKQILIAALIAWAQLDIGRFPRVQLTGPDLMAGAPHLTEDRAIAFTVMNRSNVGTPKTFQAVLYVNGAVKQTFTVNGARGYTIQSFKTSDAWMNCGPLLL